MNVSKSKRPISNDLEEMLFTELPVLDRGFIRVVDYMGNDSAIVQAARVSYGTGTKSVSQDKGLINYLMRNKHTSPFEMCEIKLHVKLPIFVARQWLRHRTANVNEYSARYSIMDYEFYLPNIDVLSSQSSDNKQARSSVGMSYDEAKEVLEMLKIDASQCYVNYKKMLNCEDDGSVINNNKSGVAREIARMNLTLNYYTQFYWKIDLHNLLHFIKLRAHVHAQYEIRVYAELLMNIVKSWVPYVYDAFIKYEINSYNISAQALQLIRDIIAKEDIDYKKYGITKREWDDIKGG